MGYFLKTFFLKKSGFPPFFGPLGPPGPCRDLGNALLSISASPCAGRPYSRRLMIRFTPPWSPAVVTPKIVMGLFPARIRKQNISELVTDCLCIYADKLNNETVYLCTEMISFLAQKCLPPSSFIRAVPGVLFFAKVPCIQRGPLCIKGLFNISIRP